MGSSKSVVDPVTISPATKGPSQHWYSVVPGPQDGDNKVIIDKNLWEKLYNALGNGHQLKHRNIKWDAKLPQGFPFPSLFPNKPVFVVHGVSGFGGHMPNGSEMADFIATLTEQDKSLDSWPVTGAPTINIFTCSSEAEARKVTEVL